MEDIVEGVMGRMIKMVAAMACAASLLSTYALPNASAADQAVGLRVGSAHYGTMALNCDNGRIYPIRPRAVTEYGELVTGYLVMAPHSSVHVRLMPRAEGYRYAGLGVYFDGLREEAVLFLSKRHAVACSVEYT